MSDSPEEKRESDSPEVKENPTPTASENIDSSTEEKEAPTERRTALNLVFGAAFRALIVSLFLLWLGIFFIDSQYQFEKIFSLVVGVIFLLMAIFGFIAQPEDPSQQH